LDTAKETHHVDETVVGDRVRCQRDAATDVAAVAHRDLEHALAAVGDDDPVDAHREAFAGGGEAGPGGAEHVAQPAEARLELRGLLCSVDTDADVHRVDGDLPVVVDQEVQPAWGGREQRARSVGRRPRDPDPAGEVVAGAERHQAHHGVGQPPPRTQHGHDLVQAAVAAEHDHRPPVAGGQYPFEIGGVRGAPHLDLGGRTEHLHRVGRGPLVRATGVGVGDGEDPRHAVHATDRSPDGGGAVRGTGGRLP